MQVRRSLAAALAVGSLLLATACAGDDLSGQALRRQPSASGVGRQGPVTISGQNFPEAALVAAMYDQLLDEGRLRPRTSSWSTPATSTWRPSPRASTSCRSTSAASSTSSTPPRTATTPSRSTAGDGQELADAGQGAARRAGHHPARPVRRRPTPTPSSSPRTSPRPRASPSCPTSRAQVVLAAAPDCEGRLDCEGGLTDQYGIDVTEVLPLGYASDQTYQSVIDGESQLGETSTTDGTLEQPGPGPARGRQADPAGAEPRARR